MQVPPMDCDIWKKTKSAPLDAPIVDRNVSTL